MGDSSDTCILFLQIAHSLCDIYVKLKDLGLKQYLNQTFEDKLKCPVPISAIEKEVYCMFFFCLRWSASLATVEHAG